VLWIALDPDVGLDPESGSSRATVLNLVQQSYNEYEYGCIENTDLSTHPHTRHTAAAKNKTQTAAATGQEEAGHRAQQQQQRRLAASAAAPLYRRSRLLSCRARRWGPITICHHSWAACRQAVTATAGADIGWRHA
jgi:hypothetical protein